MDGYIYILINATYPNLLKIGQTRKSPEERAAELSSSTGVPTPFIVAFEAQTSDPEEAERRIHSYLQENGYRVSKHREFFDLPLKRAVELVMQILTNDKALCYGHPGNVLDSPVPEDGDGEYEVGDDIISEANDYLHGTNGKFQDIDAYTARIHLAKKLGNKKANLLIATQNILFGHQNNDIRLIKSGISDVQALVYDNYGPAGHLEEPSDFGLMAT